jgi:hypothetical protein
LFNVDGPRGAAVFVLLHDPRGAVVALLIYSPAVGASDVPTAVMPPDFGAIHTGLRVVPFGLLNIPMLIFG